MEGESGIRVEYNYFGKRFPWTAGFEGRPDSYLNYEVRELRFVIAATNQEIQRRKRSKSLGAESPEVQSVDDSLKLKKVQSLLHETVKNYQNDQYKRVTFDEWLSVNLPTDFTRIGLSLKNFVQKREIPIDPQKENARYWHLETLVYLINNHISLAHALVFLYAFPVSTLKGWKLEQMYALFQYILLNQESLVCEFFQGEALKLANSPRSAAEPFLSPFNFLSLADNSQIIVALIICYGGTQVPDLLFRRFLTRQHRWSDSGNITVADPPWAVSETDLNFTRRLMDLFGDRTRQIERLSGSWLYIDSAEDPLRKTYTMYDHVKDQIIGQWTRQDREKWYTIAFQMICHVFPRDTAWEQYFRTHGDFLAPCLDHVIQMSFRDQPPLSEPMKVILVETLIAKAKLGKRHSPRNALEYALTLIEETTPKHLQIDIVLQMSISARLEGDIAGSEQAIQDYSDPTWRLPAENVREDALITLLLISHLENLHQLEQNESLHQATIQLSNLDFLTDNSEGRGAAGPSEMQLRVDVKKKLTLSKVLISNGEPQMALEWLLKLRELLQDRRLSEDLSRYQALCALCDLLCASNCSHCCTEAREIICQEIQRISKTPQRLNKALLRLKIMWLEIDLAEERFPEVYMESQLLKDIFKNLESPDISDDWLYARLVSISARAAFHQGARYKCVQEWREFMRILDKGNAQRQTTGFLTWVAQVSIYLAVHLQPNFQQSPAAWEDELRTGTLWEDINKTSTVVSPNFFIAPMTTRWLPSLVSMIRGLHGIVDFWKHLIIPPLRCHEERARGSGLRT